MHMVAPERWGEVLGWLQAIDSLAKVLAPVMAATLLLYFGSVATLLGCAVCSLAVLALSSLQLGLTTPKQHNTRNNIITKAIKVE